MHSCYKKKINQGVVKRTINREEIQFGITISTYQICEFLQFTDDIVDGLEQSPFVKLT